MGARMLRAWLTRPLSQAEAIRRRLDAVDRLTRQRALLNELRESLGAVRDLERLIARLGAGHGNARDLNALALSLHPVPGLRERVAASGDPLLAGLAERLHALPELVGLITAAIAEQRGFLQSGQRVAFLGIGSGLNCLMLGLEW